jgi:hypothetical protein
MAFFTNPTGLYVNNTGNPVECTTCPCSTGTGCGECNDSFAVLDAMEWDITLSGFDNGVLSGCTNCQNMDNTYRAAYIGGCGWEYDNGGTQACTIAAVNPLGEVGLAFVEEGGDIILRVTVTGPLAGVTQWATVIQAGSTVAVDCSALTTAINLPFEFSNDSFDSCSQSQTTCVVLLVP